MLLQNRSIWFGLGTQYSSSAFAQRRNQMGMNANNNMNRYDGENGMSRGSSVPNGYRNQYSWLLCCEPKYGASVTSKAELSVDSTINGNGILPEFLLAGGRNLTISGDGAMHGYGTIPTTDISLILYAIATLQGNGQIASDSQLSGTLQMAATLAGNGELVPALGAIAGLVITLNGTGTINNSTASGKGYMSANITPFTELSPQNLAIAIWNSLAASFDEAGTMGQKLNAAGTAGDPWTATVPGAYADGTAGYKLGNMSSGGSLTPEQEQMLQDLHDRIDVILSTRSSKKDVINASQL